MFFVEMCIISRKFLQIFDNKKHIHRKLLYYLFLEDWNRGWPDHAAALVFCLLVVVLFYAVNGLLFLTLIMYNYCSAKKRSVPWKLKPETGD